jgi:hypothetical protein
VREGGHEENRSQGQRAHDRRLRVRHDAATDAPEPTPPTNTVVLTIGGAALLEYTCMPTGTDTGPALYGDP